MQTSISPFVSQKEEFSSALILSNIGTVFQGSLKCHHVIYAINISFHVKMKSRWLLYIYS